jgi:hypothetical protein
MPRLASTTILLFKFSAYLEWQECTNTPAFIGWDGVSLTFCLGWPQTMIFLISASQVAGITGANHHTVRIKAFSGPGTVVCLFSQQKVRGWCSKACLGKKLPDPTWTITKAKRARGAAQVAETLSSNPSTTKKKKRKKSIFGKSWYDPRFKFPRSLQQSNG